MMERQASAEPDQGRLLNQGRYRLDAPLGKGATATVWRATDTVLGVTRAIKLLNPRAAGHSTLRKRLLSEARAMAQLRHPNILHVYDIGFDGDRDYVVMDLAEQGSLADWVDAWGPMPPDLALPCMIQVLSALQAAHVRGIVHRDVKPQNILLDQEGVAHLADFGIALLAEDQLRTTRTGMAMGSLAFMAPEQRLDARSVTAAADVYAAGTTLYNLLTAANPVDLFAAGPDSGRWRGLPPELAQVVGRAVAYAPTDRYPDARAMGQALVALLGQAASAPLPPAAHAPPLPGHEPGQRLHTPLPARDLRPSTSAVTAAITLLAEDLEPQPGAAPTVIEPAEALPAAPPAPTDPQPPDSPDSQADKAFPEAAPHPASGPADDTAAKPQTVPPSSAGRAPASSALRALAALALFVALAVAWWRWPQAPAPADLSGPSPSAPAPQPPAEAAPPPPITLAEALPVEQGAAEAPDPRARTGEAAPQPSPTGVDPAVPVATSSPRTTASGGAGAGAPGAGTASAGAPAPAAPQAATTPAAGAITGSWTGNVHVQRGHLVLQGTDRALTGSLTTTHPTTGVARTVAVRGHYDEERRSLVLEEELDPAQDPTAGSYEATLAEDGRTLTGRYRAKVGGRTANIKLSRGGGGG